MTSSEEVWDFFVSFAAPDQALAEQLTAFLEQRGWRVFCSDQSIAPGADWNTRLTTALEHSRAVAVLLSENSADAHYQQEEIHLAVRLGKKVGLKVVPVYLDGIPSQPAAWEFGLRSYQRIDYQQAKVLGTAEKLGDVLLDTPSEERLHREPTGRQTVGEMFHGAALKIDRTKQWLPLVKICASQENALFLLHGPRRQNVDLFISRVWHYLSQECETHHRSYVVPLRVEYATPRSPAAWENHLRAGVAGEGGEGGTAEDVLREATRSHPVFLVLNRLPIGSDLDEVELEAFERFLDERFPRLISRASAGQHPIRALVATHYDQMEESLVDRLDQRAYRGCRAFNIRYRKLQPLKPLEWDDIEDFLDNLETRPPRAIYRQLRASFESLDLGRLQYRDVVELLERELY